MRSTASVAQAVRKRRGCLSGWHSLPRQSGNVVGVCLGGILGDGGGELPSTRYSGNVVDVCLAGIHWRRRSTTSVAQAVRKRRGCLTGWHSLLRQSGNVVGVCLGGIQWMWKRGAFDDHAVRKRRGCLSGWNSPDEEYRNRRPGSPETSWVSDWVAFVAQAVGNVVGVCLGGIHRRWRRELLSTRFSGNVVDVCLAGIHWRRRSTASVAQAVRKRRGCLFGWHSLPRQSGNVVGVCLGGIQWMWKRGAFDDQAVRKRGGCLSVWNSPEEVYRIRRPGSPETSWVSVWVAFVAHAVRERRGCLSG